MCACVCSVVHVCVHVCSVVVGQSFHWKCTVNFHKNLFSTYTDLEVGWKRLLSIGV